MAKVEAMVDGAKRPSTDITVDELPDFDEEICSAKQPARHSSTFGKDVRGGSNER